jgi:hypothetical protein
VDACAVCRACLNLLYEAEYVLSSVPYRLVQPCDSSLVFARFSVQILTGTSLLAEGFLGFPLDPPGKNYTTTTFKTLPHHPTLCTPDIEGVIEYLYTRGKVVKSM